ncbi:MAG: hypothetical protein IJY61_03720 [Candidatus Gastranaerophilales bacterium]|nr:hypothetical protein [Candidatus Gastranaerophilales bacterium]
MQKFATCFSVIFLLLSVSMLFSVLYFNLPLLLAGNRIVLFVFLNSIMLCGVAVFFLMFKERIIQYIQNYRREKTI